MVDVSDGLATDARRLGIGMALDAVPVADGASWDDALLAGEDYELVFTAPDRDRVLAAFDGLEPPIEIGRCTDDGVVRLGDDEMPHGGWEHQW
jgi:thiamine monophosphate kinase